MIHSSLLLIEDVSANLMCFESLAEGKEWRSKVDAMIFEITSNFYVQCT
jgi:hypothetical protein